ncbi:MAG: hypothetical protein Ct9H90mP11_05340 [Acidimicrobiales bacterium]|nr:MAG: hypothetical protein Ct9H90mP11_05340 [Acidimicrobiales bacterium]
MVGLDSVRELCWAHLKYLLREEAFLEIVLLKVVILLKPCKVIPEVSSAHF